MAVETAETPEVADSGQNEGRGEAAPQSQEIGRAAAVLGRLGASVPSLALSASDVMKLAPLAAQWLERGVTELQLRNELAEGLPTPVKSPRALLADRLTRKMPAVPVKVEPLAECPECGTYLPRGQKTGICGHCAGVAPVATTHVEDHDWRNAKKRAGVMAPAAGRALMRSLLTAS